MANKAQATIKKSHLALTDELNFFQAKSLSASLSFLFLIYVLLIYKTITVQSLHDTAIFVAYSVLVAVYILSRFLFAYFYNPEEFADYSFSPTISFVTPAKNEADNIGQTLRSMLSSDYPSEKIEIIAINDGSDDDTLSEMLSVKKEADAQGIRMEVINWTQNRGKRHGMAEGTRRARGEIIIFVDSDSFVVPSTARELVKYFKRPNIGAVSGHCDVYNRDKNILTKMQAVRFFVAFRAYKSAEALFGAVTCCSGCLAAYRRSYIIDILDPWLNQKFLGSPCTYGDDRSLTNYLLKQGYDTIYSDKAYSQTVVPDNWPKFMKQQLRWKKSWTRESFLALLFMWKRNPIAFISFALGVFLPLFGPFIAARALVWIPTIKGIFPLVYVSGLIFMSFIYGIYYRIYRKDNLWIYGMLFTWIYSLVLIWQLPYAVLTLRDSRWGTR